MRAVNLFALAAAGATALNDADILHRLEALEAKYTEVTAKNAEIQAALNATTAGELKVFNADECPPGWVEFNKTQGYLLTGRPKGGETGTTINRPMDVGEEGRSPEHSHEVGVEDLGHTHETVVNDPGHNHSVELGDNFADPATSIQPTADKRPPTDSRVTSLPTVVAKTGIIVDALAAKSNIQVSLTSNKDGEGYPLVYVLVCQRLGN
jgi:hypothetical protein